MGDNIYSKKITFVGAEGDSLAANLELPPGQPVIYALFAHCFTCSKDVLAAVRISRALTQFGIAVLRFDFTGLGESAGDFANTNFSSNKEDLIKAADFLRENYQAPQLLIGHSLGGAAVLAAAEQIPEAKALATIGAPADTKDLKHLLTGKLDEIRSKGKAEVTLAERKFFITQQFLEDIEKHHLLNTISKLNKALLIFHSPQDAIVNINNAMLIFNAAPQPKSFVSLDGADHMLSRKEEAMYVANVLSAWISRYIPFMRSNTDQTGVVVWETKVGLYTQEIIVGHHVLKADEPISAGGNDLGPGPYDFILAALGACTSMTLRWYAELKHFPLERTIVKLNHHKIYAEDCKNCDSDDKNVKIDKIDRIIELEGELTEDQRNKLLEIANKCPVHRTLTSINSIETRLTDS